MDQGGLMEIEEVLGIVIFIIVAFFAWISYKANTTTEDNIVSPDYWYREAERPSGIHINQEDENASKDLSGEN